MPTYRVSYYMLSIASTEVEASTPEEAVAIAADIPFDDSPDCLEVSPCAVDEVVNTGRRDEYDCEVIEYKDTGYRSEVSFDNLIADIVKENNE